MTPVLHRVKLWCLALIAYCDDPDQWALIVSYHITMSVAIPILYSQRLNHL